MRYYKLIEGDYIIAIGEGYGGEEISQEEYDTILSIVRNRPVPETGYDYILRTDLTWETIEVEVISEEDQEISDDELFNMMMEVL